MTHDEPLTDEIDNLVDLCDDALGRVGQRVAAIEANKPAAAAARPGAQSTAPSLALLARNVAASAFGASPPKNGHAIANNLKASLILKHNEPRSLKLSIAENSIVLRLNAELKQLEAARNEAEAARNEAEAARAEAEAARAESEAARSEAEAARSVAEAELEARNAKKAAKKTAKKAAAEAAKAAAAAEEAAKAAAEEAAKAVTEAAAEAAANQRAQQIEALHCQLTFDLFADPVCTSDGHTYEREAIEEAWRVGRELADERMHNYLNAGAGGGDVCGECCEAAPEPFAFRSPNTGAEVTDALVPNHLIIRQIEALIDAGGIITAEEAAEWRTRRETALLRQRERQQRPTSAPTELQRRVRDREAGEMIFSDRSELAVLLRMPVGGEAEKAGSSLMHAAAAAGRSLRRSASLSRRTVALPFQAVSASATRFSQWSAQRSLELKERRRHSADEAASRRALSQYKRCPKCKVYLDKNGGCNHFTCRACRHEFCWDCGKPWSGSACRNTWCASRRR